MKNKKTLFLITIVTIAFLFTWALDSIKHSADNHRDNFERTLLDLYASAPVKKDTGNEKERPVDEPGMAAYHDFLMTFDPATGKIPRERLTWAYQQMQQMKDNSDLAIVWQGFDADMGGRTRAIMVDPNDPTHKKVWAGGITGGLWYNTNITNPASPWVPVADFWSTLTIRCLAYDPLNTQRFFVGTGEVETAMQTYRESSGLGFGLGRSDDGGNTWYHIPGTEQFAFVTDIVVRVENNQSILYVGVASGLYMGTQQSSPSDGLFRSEDYGNTWEQVLPDIPGTNIPYCVSDIALGSDNRLYVGTRPNLDGEGAAVLLWSDDGLQWTVNNQYQQEILASSENNIPGRVVLGTTPADPNVVYALIASGYINPSNGFQYFNCYHILRSADKGNTWTKKALPTNLTSSTNFATIAWHALAIGVDPNNADHLYIGGLDLHQSFNGGNHWLNVSDWAKMYSGGGSDYVHADQHTIVFLPGSSDKILFGTDGGVFYTSLGSAPVPQFAEHNKSYNTLQLYTCALSPINGFDQFYGGLQDNGTLYQVGLGEPLTIHDMVMGGDGAYCFIDPLESNISITSIYYNQYAVFDNGIFANYLGNWSSGTFVSPADLDYKKKLLFCNPVDYVGNHKDQLLRLGNLMINSTGDFLNLNTGSQVPFTALKYSPHSPADASTVYLGSAAGRLFRVTSAHTSSPQTSEIGSSLFPSATISSIVIGSSEDTLMVTFSNYGVPSVWATFNGGTTWMNIEGNLPDMPVRWGLLHPNSDRRAMIATETGVWESLDITQTPVNWRPINNGMANVRVDMLQLRASDNTVLAATHGRGFFTTKWDVATGIKSEKTSHITVSPNPSSGKFSIAIPAEITTPVTLTVYDFSGRKVWQKARYLPVSGAITANLTGFSPGIYFLNIESETLKTSIRKLIIE